MLKGSADPERLDGPAAPRSSARSGWRPPCRDLRRLTTSLPRRIADLSDGLWHRRFGADGDMGRLVTLNDDPYLVVGVMPGASRTCSPGAEVWTPLKYASQTGLRVIISVASRGCARAWTCRRGGRARGHGTGSSRFARPGRAALPDGLIVSGLKDDLIRAVGSRRS